MLFLFLLAWNQVQKILQMHLSLLNGRKFIPNRAKKLQKLKGTKNVRNGHDFKMALQDLAGPRATYCGLVWPFMVLHDLVWHCMVLYCLVMVVYSLFMVGYGLLWQNIDLIGLELSFLAVIDPISFDLAWFDITF